ncbi:MAG: AAA family ATPase [Planctomycetota bacterium]
MSSTKNSFQNSNPSVVPTRKGGNRAKGVVVRPAEQGTGQIRLDSTQPMPRSSRPKGNFQLEDYVAWLQEKKALGKSITEETYDAEQEIHREMAQELNQPVRPTPGTDAIFEQIQPPKPKTKKRVPTPHLTRKVNLAQLKLDENDTVVPSVVALESMDEFIDHAQSTLSEAEIARQITAALSRAEAVAAEQRKQRGIKPSTTSILRIDPTPDSNAKPKNVRLDAPTVEPTAVPAPASKMAPVDLPRPKLTEDEAEELVSKVSKAIASVISEKPASEMEAKVRNHFQTDIHQKSLDTIRAGSEQQVVEANETRPASTDELTQQISTAQAHAARLIMPQAHEPEVDIEIPDPVSPQATSIESKPVEKQASSIESEPAAPNFGSTKAEIPATVAAWDVDDFRWPKVTNQMIVNGSEAMAQLYDSLRKVIARQHQCLGIASLQRNAGTTTIAISLARWAAACGNNVLIIDADISNPDLSRSVGLAPNVSWANSINNGQIPIAETIIRSRKSNICVMPLAPISNREVWPRFIFDNLSAILNQVKDAFDLVIIDCGPATQLMDELSQPEILIDAAMLVHDSSESPRFRKTKNLLHTFGLEKVMVTQNKIKHKTNVA